MTDRQRHQTYGSTAPSKTTATSDKQQNPQPLPAQHLSTYTAGEDAGRLADLAKEFGLARQRQPRNQVRERVPDELSNLNLHRLKEVLGEAVERFVVSDAGYLEARFKSVYSAHIEQDEISEESSEDERSLLVNEKLPSWKEEQDENEPSELEQGGGIPVDDGHGGSLGGDLPSAVLGIIKGMVGPAILYLPHGFASAGYLVAFPVMALTTVLFLSSSTCLLESWKMESVKANQVNRNSRNKKKSRVMLSYPELAYRSFGSKGETLVKLGIALMQSGVCLTYLIFVPQNFHSCARSLFGWDISTNWCLLLMVALQIPMSWIRDIRRLTVTNLLANVLIMYGLATCLIFAFGMMRGDDDVGVVVVTDASGNIATTSDSGATNVITATPTTTPSSSLLQEVSNRFLSLTPFNPSGWFLFMGTAVLLFEGSITLLVPLQEAVQTAADRAAFPNIYKKTICSIVAFYSFFGITCWMAFGDDVRTVMTTSLPPGILATTVQLAYSIAVIFTFPLQNFPSLEIACRSISAFLTKYTCWRKSNLRSSFTNSPQDQQQRNTIASTIVISLSLIALTTMEDLDKVVSLMGSLLGCPLAFVIPPLIHNRLAKKEISSVRKIGNIIVASLGMVDMIISSIVTIQKWN